MRESLRYMRESLGIGSSDQGSLLGSRSTARSSPCSGTDPAGVIHPPDVYLFADHLGRRFGCTHIVDFGCGQPKELAKLHPKFKIVGVGVGSNLEFCRSTYRFGQWIQWTPDSNTPPPLSPEILPNSVIVCSSMVERLVNPALLLRSLKQLMEYSPVAIISTPERDLVHGADDRRPLHKEAHARWNRAEFRSLLERAGLGIDFIGLTASDKLHRQKETTVAVLANNHVAPLGEAPAGFRVVASLSTYNEEDIIVPSVKSLIEQGVEVYLIDNWSTDRTVERAQPFLGHGLIQVERFPPDGPSPTFDLARILKRKEEISTGVEADWYLHADADEIRSSPWPDVRLRDALYHVDRLGFNAVDHTELVFQPIDNDYAHGSSFEEYFRFFEFKFVPNSRINAWKKTGVRVMLADGGHRVKFAGRRIYPYNFLLKHYPVRSQRHGERKVFVERRGRYNPEARAAGWHFHYDRLLPDHNFLWDPSDLLLFDESDFYQEYLVELLGNIGPDQRAAGSAQRRQRPLWRRLASRVRRRLRRR
jgi:glycosyltransferase involved in cell wall biosynthesis